MHTACPEMQWTTYANVGGLTKTTKKFLFPGQQNFWYQNTLWSRLESCNGKEVYMEESVVQTADLFNSLFTIESVNFWLPV